MKTSLWRLLPVLALFCIAGARKEPEVTVRFYTEVSGKESDSFSFPVQLHFPPRRGYITKIPNISERDITGIYLFQAADGSVGCSFLLDEHGKVALDTLSIEKRGTSLVALVNGRQAVDILIDRRVSDGIVTIPQGLTLPEAAMLKKTFKEINVSAGKR